MFSLIKRAGVYCECTVRIFCGRWGLQSLNPGDDCVEGGLNICGGDGGHNRLLVLLKNLIHILPQKQSSQFKKQHEGISANAKETKVNENK